MDFACCSTATPATEQSRRIDRQINKERKDVQRTVKILLLGSAESGKSTFVKQMTIIHGSGEFTPEQILQYKLVIYSNCLTSMKTLIDARKRLGVAWERALDSERYAHKVTSLAHDVDSKRQLFDTITFLHIAPAIQALWQDGAIRHTYSCRSLFQIIDSCAYFFEHLPRVASMAYTPTNRDILMSRKATYSIVDYRIDIGNVPFCFTDVGGQRTQRQKWFQCFNGVTTILFLTASNEFDLVIAEDRRTNRVVESRNVFETIVNHREFERTPVILFMNKTDLLQEKVARVNCSDYLPDFRGNNRRATDVQLYLLGLFESCRKNRTRPFFYHFTTAVDTQNIRKVFDDCKSIILERSVKDILLT